jgi:hypothetical protein
LRRLAAAVLAVPVIASIYLGFVVALPGARRYLAGTLAIVVLGAVGITLAAPTPAASIPPSQPAAVSADLLQPVHTPADAAGTGNDPAAGPGSAAGSGDGADSAAGSGDGAAGLAGSGDGAAFLVGSGGPAGQGSNTGAAVGVAPQPDVIASISLPVVTQGTSRAPVRAATKLAVAGSRMTGNRVRLDTAVVLKFDRAVTLADVQASLSISPAVKGTLKTSSGSASRSSNAKAFIFTPAKALAVNTRYTITFKRVIKDADGIAVATPKVARLLTASAPSLVRFRPLKSTTDVDPAQVVSVRFTRAMNKATTARAFSVVVAGKRIAGKVSWAEGDTVVVFPPAMPFA